MKLNFIAIAFIFGLLLSSCEPPLDTSYEIFNETNIPLTINYIGYNNYEDSNQTVIILPPGKSQIIYSDHSIGTPEMAKEIDSIGIYYIKITPDSIIKKLNIKDIKNWEYYERSENSVLFYLTIK
jgi:hypothetical protein